MGRENHFLLIMVTEEEEKIADGQIEALSHCVKKTAIRPSTASTS